MPRYEIVVHLVVDLDGTTPEAAATDFKHELLDRANGAATLHGLAVWRASAGGRPAPLPPAVRRHLAEFFAGVGECAATEEAAFRGRVADIFARAAPEPGDAVDAPSRAASVEGTAADGREVACWEEDGGVIVWDHDVARGQR